MPKEPDRRDAGYDTAVPLSSLPLPAHAHIPGRGTQPDWPPLEHARSLAPTETSASNWQHNQTYIYGFAVMRAGFYWEAHEVWEPVWLAAAPNSRERILLRALIQTANAHLKTGMNRPAAAARLFAEVRDELVNFSGSEDPFMGVDLRRFSSDIEKECLDH
jgi:uncharacterized protein